jgi:hypothetical protein
VDEPERAQWACFVSIASIVRARLSCPFGGCVCDWNREHLMQDEPVIYNGVEVHANWARVMEESQSRREYVIGGVAVPRVRYGDETDDWGANRGVCHDCAAAKGQYHAFGQCDAERCPVCGGQAIGCDCEYEGDGVDDAGGA